MRKVPLANRGSDNELSTADNEGTYKEETKEVINPDISSSTIPFDTG